MKHLILNHSTSEISHSDLFTLISISIAFFIASILAMWFIIFFYNIVEVSIMLGAIAMFLFFTLIAIFAFVVFIKEKNDMSIEQEVSKNSKKLKYIDFTNLGIDVCYTNSNYNFSIPYIDIKSLQINIKQFSSRVGVSSSFIIVFPKINAISDFNIHIEYKKNNLEHKLFVKHNENIGLMDRLFNVIYFSKFIEDFSYKFTGIAKGNKTFERAIKSYINNNYKHTFYSLGYTRWGLLILILTIITLFSLLFGIGYLIVNYL